jgi:hypothetical protein
VQERGWAVEDTNVEYIGYNSLLGANADPTYRDQLNECFLRMTIRTADKKVADAFGRLFPWLGLSGPPYVGSMKGVQPAKELLGIWPTLVTRELIESKVKIEVEAPDAGPALENRACALRRQGRPRDIGLFAFDAETYAVLKREVTKVAAAGAFRRFQHRADRALGRWTTSSR